MKYIISLLIALFFNGLLSAAYVFNSRGLVEYKKANSKEWKRISSRSRLGGKPAMSSIQPLLPEQ